MGKILLLVILVAVAIYLLVRVIERRGLSSPSEPRRPVGPDDDPDFLRGLDRRPDDDR